MGRSLLVGYDLCDERTQIAVYDEKKREPVIVGADDENPDVFLETAVTMPSETESITNFLLSVRKGEAVFFHNKKIDEIDLLSYFFRKTLSIVRKEYPGETILQLVVTIEEEEREFVHIIYSALEKIGIGKDRAAVMNHKQSYLYFTLCQEKDIWISDVGMFEYDERGLFYYQMNIERRRSPILIGVNKGDYTESMEICEDEEGSEIDKGAVFENLVRSAVHRQMISTLYMTGSGFDGGWATKVFQKLCVGRRVFVGKNLYVSGACYAARELSGRGTAEEFVYLDDERIQVHITVNVYADAGIKEIYLVKAGTPWYQAEREFDLIPDGEEELTVKVTHVLRRETKEHIITLEGIHGRTERMTRIGVKVRFSDIKTCIITMKDKGFGEFKPSTNRIWEKIITMK